MASARSATLMKAAELEMDSLLLDRHKIALGQPADFEVANTTEIANVFGIITGTLTMMLAAIAGISLVVGGVGIMNIMLVSVTERTREIGIRLAVGAQGRQVLLQFLVESVVLSFLGGVLGSALGLALAFVASRMMSIPFTPDASVVALAFLFSAAVGVVFGYFPARAAARLDPIEALRHE